jgi:hypothetical protein
MRHTESTSPRECALSHLTLQEVIDRVNNRYLPIRDQRRAGDRGSRPHHPEFYVPRITRFFAGLLLGAFPAASRMAVAQKRNDPHSVLS